MRVERSTKDQMVGRLSQLAKEKERAEKKSDTTKFETDYNDVVKAKDEEEAERKAERARKRKELKRQKRAAKEKPPDANGEEEDEVEEEGVNPDMAAMMGFSGFGDGK